MSKEATGNHGQVLGSFSYFSRINRATFWGNLPITMTACCGRLQAAQRARLAAFMMIFKGGRSL